MTLGAAGATTARAAVAGVAPPSRWPVVAVLEDETTGPCTTGETLRTSRRITSTTGLPQSNAVVGPRTGAKAAGAAAALVLASRGPAALLGGNKLISGRWLRLAAGFRQPPFSCAASAPAVFLGGSGGHEAARCGPDSAAATTKPCC